MLANEPGAARRRRYNRAVAREHVAEIAGEPTCTVDVAGVECRQPAAMLLLGNIDHCAGGLDQFNSGDGAVWVEPVGDALQENVDIGVAIRAAGLIAALQP